MSPSPSLLLLNMMRRRHNKKKSSNISPRSNTSMSIETGQTNNTKPDEREKKKLTNSTNYNNKTTTNTNVGITKKLHHYDNNTKNAFRISKFLILRLLGLVYFMAFLGAWYQNKGLVGMNGLIPSTPYMNELLSSSSSRMELFSKHPSILWLLPYTNKIEDYYLDVITISGLILSLIVMVGISSSWILLVLLWLLDFSIVTYANTTTSFYSYGWESQLLETGFLAIFLTDIPWCTSRKEEHPSMVSLWLMRWLCFRISIGAGLIKIRGGSCWKSKTCLYYHFETQPLPSPLSFIFHFLPKTMLYHAVHLDLFVQLYSIWMVLVPGVNTFCRYVRNIGGYIQVLFMVNIMLSGNYAFLNHVTVIPALACMDDSCYPLFLQRRFYDDINLTATTATNYNHQNKYNNSARIGIRRVIRYSIDAILLITISYLSLPVISNLLELKGKHQIMNTSFNSFRLVNSYGAFGSVGESRYEPILSLSHDGTQWTEVDFPCKPGTVTRRPCFCAPYHYRLDWNIWFIGFEPHDRYLQQREQWLFILIVKLLSSTNHEELEQCPWLDLIDKSSALHYLKEQQSTSTAFKYAKVDMYHYTMSKPLWELGWEYYYYYKENSSRSKKVIWWNRSFKERLIPLVSYDKRSGKLYLANNN